MAREKKPVHKVQMTEGKRDIINDIYGFEPSEGLSPMLQIKSCRRLKIGRTDLLMRFIQLELSEKCISKRYGSIKSTVSVNI